MIEQDKAINLQWKVAILKVFNAKMKYEQVIKWTYSKVSEITLPQQLFVIEKTASKT